MEHDRKVGSWSEGLFALAYNFYLALPATFSQPILFAATQGISLKVYSLISVLLPQVFSNSFSSAHSFLSIPNFGWRIEGERRKK